MILGHPSTSLASFDSCGLIFLRGLRVSGLRYHETLPQGYPFILKVKEGNRLSWGVLSACSVHRHKAFREWTHSMAGKEDQCGFSL